MIGVNLAGAEFGDLGTSHGTGYIYPDASNIDYYADNGMELIRLPFRWERLQPELGGEFDAAELGRIREFVDHAASRGLTVVLDVHNYGKYDENLIGSSEVPNESFADLWSKLATEFKSDANVWFGLMNEPHEQSASQWIESANAAIDAIRDTGATQKIMVPGSYWSGSYSWTTTDNHTVVGEGVVDPLNNYAFEVHLYFDGDNSGTNPDAVSATIGVERVEEITAWAKETGNQLFLGEFGVSRDSLSLEALDKLMAHMAANADVWAGATYWAGGPWWGDYMFSAEPRDGEDSPQLAILQKYDLGGEALQPTPRPSEDVVEEVGEEEVAEEEPADPVVPPEDVVEEEPADPLVPPEEVAEEEPADPFVPPEEVAEGEENGEEDAGEEEVVAGPAPQQPVPETPEDEPVEDVVDTVEDPIIEDPVIEEATDEPAEPRNATVAIRNAGDGSDHFDEGESFGITISVKNAAAGQTFQLWMANSANGDDFDNSLEADLLAALPDDVDLRMLDDRRAEITLKDGSYDFTITRGVALDGTEETTDQSPWADGNQEQVDFWISDFSEGLTSSSTVASYWLGDVAAEAAPEVAGAVLPVTAESELEVAEVSETMEQPASEDEEPASEVEPVSSVEAGGETADETETAACADAFFEKFIARFEERADEWLAAKLADAEASGGRNAGKDGGNNVFRSDGFEAANADLDASLAKTGGPSAKASEVAHARAGSFDWLADPMIDAANDEGPLPGTGSEYT